MTHFHVWQKNSGAPDYDKSISVKGEALELVLDVKCELLRHVVATGSTHHCGQDLGDDYGELTYG